MMRAATGISGHAFSPVCEALKAALRTRRSIICHYPVANRRLLCSHYRSIAPANFAVQCAFLHFRYINYLMVDTDLTICVEVEISLGRTVPPLNDAVQLATTSWPSGSVRTG
jgi:hypothetical protein